MPNLNLNLTPDQATALYLALDNTIYFGTDFKDRFTKQQREDVLDIFKQARPYNPQWRKNNEQLQRKSTLGKQSKITLPKRYFAKTT